MNSEKSILVVDDEDIRFILAKLLERAGYRTVMADNGVTAVKLVREKPIDAVIMDIRMPGIDGIEAMKQMKVVKPTLPVLIMTAYGGTHSAVQAVKSGAYDYFEKPFDTEKVVIAIRDAMAELDLKLGVNASHLTPDTPINLTELMGFSEEIRMVFNQINLIALTNFSVVLYGETGSGKELVAMAIHNLSLRKNGKLIAVDCGAIPETLVESEFFGYERGAFTGAEKRKEGCFERAAKTRGTLFLDEIGNFLPHMQRRLLRTLEERCIRRVGGNEDIPIDIRVIAASNERLEDLVKAGRFRRDLYYRLNEISIEIPPLRRRKDDVIFLAKRFLDITNRELGKDVCFSGSASDLLLTYDWPGNVRELRNVVRRGVLLADNVIDTDTLNLLIRGIEPKALSDPIPDLMKHLFEVKMDADHESSLRDIVKKGVKEIERRVIADVLKLTGGNKSKAARMLKIDYKTMHYKVKEYNIRA